MMRIKKYFSFLLSIAITLSFNLYPMQAIAENLSEVYKAYDLSIFSNTCDITSSEVLESNGKFYMNIEDIAKLARFELTTESDNSQNTFILRQGVRKICIQKETGDLLDYIRYVHVTGGNEHRINQITIPYLLIESKYYYECIPLLTYLGAECKTSELGGLIVTMPAYTLWETIVPDMEKYWRDTNINNQSVEEKQWTIRIDVANDLLGDIWSIPEKWGDTYKTGEYLEQALYEVFDVNVMKFESVRNHIGETNKVKNENIETLLTAADIMKDSADIAGEKTWEYTSSFLEKFGYVPKESSDALKETLGDAADIEFSFLLAAIDSYNTIEHRLNYDEHTKNCFLNILNDDVLEYITSLVFDKEEFEVYKNEIKKNENESDFIKKFLNEPIKSKLEEKYGIPKWLPDGYIEFIEFSNIEYFLDWKTKALDISKTLKDSGKLAEDVLREKYTSATIETIMDVGAEKGLEMLVGSLPASFGMLSTSIMTDVVLKDNFEASKSQIYSYTLNEMQYDILEPLTFVSMDTVMDNNCSDPNKLEIMRDMIALYYRITIAFCQNNAKALEEFHVGKSEREQLVSYYNQVAEYLAVYLYMITNCTVSEIPDYDDIDDSVLTEEWLDLICGDKNELNSVELYREVLDLYYHNIKNEWNGYEDKLNYDDSSVCFLWYEYETHRTLSDTGYQLVDINEDGIDELVVGTSYGSTENILDIYTIYDNKPIKIAEGVYRGSLSLYTGNEICIYNSSSATCWTTVYFHLQKDECIVYEAFLYDEDRNPSEPYFYANNKTLHEYNDFEYYDYDWKQITKDEYESGLASHVEREIDFTLFSDYVPTEVDFPDNDDSDTNDEIDNSSIPELYLNNESSWLYDSSNPFAIFWFQDLDFDGINEMIYGFEVDQFSGNVFSVWENSVSGNQFGISGWNATDALQLCYDTENQEYLYLNEGVWGVGADIAHYTIHKYQHMWMESIVGYTVDNYDGHTTYYGLHDSDSVYNSASISAEEYVRIYNEFAANLRYVDCTTEIVKVSDYINASEEERLTLLQKSYNAFHIGDIKEHVPLMSVSDIR